MNLNGAKPFKWSVIPPKRTIRRVAKINDSQTCLSALRSSLRKTAKSSVHHSVGLQMVGVEMPDGRSIAEEPREDVGQELALKGFLVQLQISRLGLNKGLNRTGIGSGFLR